MNTKGLRGGLADEAYRRIKHKILVGDLPLGRVFSRRSLLKELEMSFSPISDALQRLEAEGFVESRPRVGTVVRIPSLRDVRGYYVVRQALEAQAARLFAEKASAEEGREVMEMAIELDRLFEDKALQQVDREKWLRVHELDLGRHGFHMRIAECTGIQVLCDFLQKVHTLILHWQFNTMSEFRGTPSKYHEGLVETMLRGDPFQAEEAMRKHIYLGEKEIVRRMEQYVKKMNIDFS